jgi:hypothetical protein
MNLMAKQVRPVLSKPEVLEGYKKADLLIRRERANTIGARGVQIPYKIGRIYDSSLIFQLCQKNSNFALARRASPYM